jgi:hypothetical protein
MAMQCLFITRRSPNRAEIRDVQPNAEMRCPVLFPPLVPVLALADLDSQPAMSLIISDLEEVNGHE